MTVPGYAILPVNAAGMKKILIIEDHEHKEENIRQLLGFSNYVVLVAADGREGIGLACGKDPTLSSAIPVCRPSMDTA